MESLKPCSKCKSENVQVVQTCAPYSCGWECCGSDPDTIIYWVQCDSCGHWNGENIEYKTEEDAISEWNA